MKKEELKAIIKEELNDVIKEIDNADYTKRTHEKYRIHGNEMVFHPPLHYNDILEVGYQMEIFVNNFEKNTKVKVNFLKLEYDGTHFKLFLNSEDVNG